MDFLVDIDNAWLFADQCQCSIGHIGWYQMAEEDRVVVYETVRCQCEIWPTKSAFERYAFGVVCGKALFKSIKSRQCLKCSTVKRLALFLDIDTIAVARAQEF